MPPRFFGKAPKKKFFTIDFEVKFAIIEVQMVFFWVLTVILNIFAKSEMKIIKRIQSYGNVKIHQC